MSERDYGNNSFDKLKAKHPQLIPKPRLIQCSSLEESQVHSIMEKAEEIKDWHLLQPFALILLARCSGARPKELRLAKVSDLDCRCWTLKIEHPKEEASYGEPKKTLILPIGRPLLKRYLTMRAKVIGSRCPLNEALFPAVNDPGDGFFAMNSLEKMKGKVEEEVGFSFDLRTCRRTCGQMCIDQGVSVESVSIMLGHSTTKTTESYYCGKREDSALREVASVFQAGNSRDEIRLISKNSSTTGSARSAGVGP